MSEIDKLQDNCFKNPFPGTNVSPATKDTLEFGNKVGLAIWSQNAFYSSSTMRAHKVFENRTYAQNNQNIEKYKPIIDPSYNWDDDKKKIIKGSLVNISWRVFSPAKKFMNTVVGMFIDSRFSHQFNAIDKGSRGEREQKKNELIGKIYAADVLKQIAQITGNKVPGLEGNEQQLTSGDDVEFYIQTEYRLLKEMGMEMLVSNTLKQNRFYENIEPRLVHDLVENNQAQLRTHFMPDHSIGIKYVDTIGYVAPFTNHPTNEYNEYDGEINLFSIKELRELIYSTEGYDPKADVEELLFKVAQQATGRYGNPSSLTHRYTPGMTEFPWNDFRVEALIFDYYSIDSEFVRFKDKDGKVFADKKNEAPKQRESHIEYVNSEKEVIREGIYLPYLGKTIAWRKVPNMARPLTENGASSRVTRRFLSVEPNKQNGVSSSLLDDCKASLDEIAISTYKCRQLISEAAPPGFWVDWESLSTVMLQNVAVTPAELINIFKTKGIGIFNGVDEQGVRKSVPLHEIKSEFGNALNSHIMYINQHINLIREAIGVNEAMDGSVKNKDALVGIQRMKAISANRLLRELFNAYSLQLFKNLGDTLRDMIQTQIKYGWKEKEHREIIGDACYEALKMEGDKPFPLFGCHVEAVADEDQINLIQSQIELGLKSGTIMPSDVIDVMNIGNPKKILQALKFRERKLAEQRSQQMQQATEMEALKNQSAAEARAKSEIAIVEAKKLADMEREALRHKNKLAEITQELMLMGSNKISEVDRIADRDDEQIVLAASVSNGSGGGGSNYGGRRPNVYPTPPKKKTYQTPEDNKNKA
jgi:hypothetical protein